MICILTLKKDVDVGTFYGFCEQDGRYYEFAIDEEWPYAEAFEREFDGHEDFMAFILKFKPWVQFARQPIEVEEMTYAALEGIATIEIRVEQQPRQLAALSS